MGDISISIVIPVIDFPGLTLVLIGLGVLVVYWIVKVILSLATGG